MSQIKTPPFADFPFVSNEKITLRQLLHSDLGDLIEISFYDAVQATTLEQAIEMNSKINKDYEEGNSIHWAIVDNLTNKVVGTCGYYRGFDQGQGEIGCVLLPNYRGNGFMTHAIELAIKFGIKTMGLHRIWAATNKQNEKAIKLLERLDFKKIKALDDDNVEFEFRLP
ncbi:GNAT family N-acetyltransferase [Flavobacterium sp. XGLA_31]|uniref:GNAT family N-acetyltransferase n=1 Tax=Flavobacterium sp. XGLA_31 TaxID=3447666 RepID=UPI003F30F5E4